MLQDYRLPLILGAMLPATLQLFYKGPFIYESDFSSADILLPQNTDLEKWSVIAQDQFTSDPNWNKVQTFVGNEPSTLNLTLPEIYLNTLMLTT